MISLQKLDSASGAVDYYLKTVEYYGDGIWLGEGAKELLISGKKVEQEEMMSLLMGNLPNGQKLGFTSRDKSTGEIETKHRPGFDITFSAPKMFSILVESNSAPELKKAFDETVSWLVSKLENDFAEAMYRVDGRKNFEKTGNLIVAVFKHPDSRMGDPETHAHLVTMNATKCIDSKYRSLSSDMTNKNGFYEQLWKQRNYLGIQARNILLNKVQELGKYETVSLGNGLWDITLPKNNIYKSVTKHFSKSRQKIEQYLGHKGWTSTKLASIAAQRVRNPKAPIQNLNAWREGIKEECLKLGLNLDLFTNTLKNTEQNLLNKIKIKLLDRLFSKEEKSVIQAKESIHTAIHALSEREAVFTERAISEKALKHIIHNGYFVKNEKLKEQISEAVKSGVLYEAKQSIDGQKQFTTPWQLTIEMETLARVQQGENQCLKICTLESAEKTLSSIEKRTKLTPTPSQKSALMGVLTSKDRFINIQGFAGTGKTKMINLLSEISSQHGVEIIGSSTSATATHELEKKGSISSELLIKRLGSLEKGQMSLENKMLILDESSMVSSQQFHLIAKLVEENGGRLCFLGDKDQCPSPAAGKDFELGQKFSDKTLYVKDFVRFKEEGLKNAAIAMTERDIKSAMDHLTEIVEKETHTERLEYIAEKYLSLNKEQQNNTMLVALSHKERGEITNIIREGLVQQNKLSKIEHVTPKLIQSYTEQIDLRKSSSYEEGQVVLFNKNISAHRISPGEYLKVGEITKTHLKHNTLPLIRENGRQLKFKLDNLPKYNETRREIDRPIELFKEETLSLREQDKIIVKKNNSKLGIRNSDLGTIQEITDQAVKVNINGQVHEFCKDDKALSHLDHAYVLTTFSSQGSDKKNVIALAESYNVFSAVFSNLYVELTRAHHNICLVVDKKEAVIESVNNNLLQGKTSALELVDHETVIKHRERFKYCPQAIDTTEVIKKDSKLKEEEQKTYAVIEQYRQAKEAGNASLSAKLASEITKSDHSLLLFYKELAYRPNEFAADILKLEEVRLKRSLTKEQQDKFLLVRNYQEQCSKVAEQLNQINIAGDKKRCNDLNKEKLNKIKQQRNKLAHEIVENIEEFKPFLSLYSIGKPNTKGYLQHVHYQLEEKAINRLNKLEEHSKTHQILSDVKEFSKRELSNIGRLAQRIKRNYREAHPFIIQESKIVGKSKDEYWKEINIAAYKHRQKVIRERLNPEERKQYDFMQQFKEASKNIALLIATNTDGVNKDKINLLEKVRRDFSTKIDIKYTELLGLFKLETQVIGKALTKNKLLNDLKGLSHPIGIQEKLRIVSQFEGNVKECFPLIKESGVELKTFNKLLRIHERSVVFEELDQPQKDLYRDVIRYKVLQLKSAKMWKKAFEVKGKDVASFKILASRAALESVKRDKAATIINTTKHQYFVDKENINNEKLQEYSEKYNNRLIYTRTLENSIISLQSRKEQYLSASNMKFNVAWEKDYQSLKSKVKKYEKTAENKSKIDELSLNKDAVRYLDKLVNKVSNTRESSVKHQKQQRESYNLEQINQIVTSDPKAFYAQIFGEPKKVSSTELRWSGGLVVSLRGSKKGLWYDFSAMEGGNIFNAIVRENGLSKPEAMKVLAEMTGVQGDKEFKLSAPNKSAEGNNKEEIKLGKRKEKSARSIWNGSIEVKGTLAEKYLKKHRGITELDSLDVRFWPKGASWIDVNDKGILTNKVNKIPALIVSAKNIKGKVTGVQRIYLDQETAKKNSYFETAKLSKGTIKGSFCYLQKGIKGGDLYLAEGVETAASIAIVRPTAHVLVSLGKGNMKNSSHIIKEIKPGTVKIAADNDGNLGMDRSIKDTLDEFKMNGIKPEVLMPNLVNGMKKTDWNDILVSSGKSRLSSELAQNIAINSIEQKGISLNEISQKQVTNSFTNQQEKPTYSPELGSKTSPQNSIQELEI